MSFDAVLCVDWSGGNDRGSTPKKDAIWTCLARRGTAEDPVYHRNRQVAEEAIRAVMAAELDAGRRILVTFDLCFAYPAGFAEAVTGRADPLALWDWIEARVDDSPTGNNRFDLAAEMNRRFPGTGPFWFNALPRDIPDLPRKGSDRQGHGMPDLRATDVAAKGAFSPFQLAGAGAVGGQVIMGMPVLARLRRRFGDRLSVWPFERAQTPAVLAETYFSLLPGDRLDPHAIKDAAQVQTYARAFSALPDRVWSDILARDASEEGWVIGLDHEEALAEALTGLRAPPLSNDCFALPPGVDWTPVAAAKAHLRAHLRGVCGAETVPLMAAAGRILATDLRAQRSNPPAANAAVDGYAIAGPLAEGVHRLPLQAGRAAAGAPFDGTLRARHALRILTGANMPAGADSVVMQEDVATDGAAISLRGPVRAGANVRQAGEDVAAGDVVLHRGRKLAPGDLALLAATGHGRCPVFRTLRVGVMSTGDEIADPGAAATAAQIFDANRPMLLADVVRWGFQAIDLGRHPDDRDALRVRLTEAAARCDAILTTGGASAGDEDHISALLKDTGSFALWRVAMKPGRPLVLGMWDGVPVFGLPGNPVAAQVTALVFVHPALHVMAGADWPEPQPVMLPAAFSKTKKAGRREYLRARLTPDGRVEVFGSEGSGRISGLAWASGLVSLSDAAQEIRPGTPVAYTPFAAFGL